ncbi:hypothetical protein Q5Y75_10390 [Ruegeria sp. 2205SS24-7]|uniref:hypothetical protein n=1 Tax=Ruegeria discodermiae TaxID=3064389 RepID=UPI002740A07D|nr:hypothetical protein [Ruegeria sp. 2205SS24-7]MDP5217627.1 hypothetical protein [Ruegeria sp. 2205SS24-7]
MKYQENHFRDDQNILDSILKKIRDDKGFGRQLKTHPKAALREFFEIPEHVELKVVFDTADTKYIHVPFLPVGLEISDRELLAAHGGTTPFCVLTAVSGALGSAMITHVTYNHRASA